MSTTATAARGEKRGPLITLLSVPIHIFDWKWLADIVGRYNFKLLSVCWGICLLVRLVVVFFSLYFSVL